MKDYEDKVNKNTNSSGIDNINQETIYNNNNNLININIQISGELAKHNQRAKNQAKVKKALLMEREKIHKLSENIKHTSFPDFVEKLKESKIRLIHTQLSQAIEDTNL